MLEKHYDPKSIEEKWFKRWEESGCFHSEPDSEKEPYTMVIPPPNVTGMLHMGHVLNNSIQDMLARYKRMQGYNVCWVPGTDHAGIATQTMVEKKLREEGIDPDTLSREELLRRIWDWKEKFGGIIIQQLRKLGSSCDWERERFTMDEGLSRAVLETFVQLYRKGLLYKGSYIVNWCPKLQTALSDDEVERSEEPSFLWHFRYPLVDSDDYLVVATTRPETMLGDTGVAVHPDDERYQHLIGKMVELPLVGRKIPVFADKHVDMDFGTGCVKITPAHDANDFEMGQKHGLDFINVMDRRAYMNDAVPEKYRGMYRDECRKATVADMEAQGLLEKIEPHTVAVGRCYRTKDIIEPYLSEQWFIKMRGMAERALVPVERGEIKFHPQRWVNTYKYWLENIKDWCISRQLKWGHRIPVWNCLDCGHELCEVEPPAHCSKCSSENLKQEEDVLDTWASSWLWPFSVFGWPENNKDLSYYYPTQTLVTAPDIIFFWVARMIMAGQEFVGKVPFKDVYFNGIVRDLQGRKMSKTLGNSPDPLDIIDTYGADAIRFTIVYQTPFGADSRFSDDSSELGRSFCTKIWNAFRFLQMSFEGVEADPAWADHEQDLIGRWILGRLAQTTSEVEQDLESFRLASAASRIYNFFWGEFCDWYVEFLKPMIKSADEQTAARLLGRTRYILDVCLKLLHPFMPFVTEEIWQQLEERSEGDYLMQQSWPEVSPSWIHEQDQKAVSLIQEIITGVRAVRKTNNLPGNAELELYVMGTDEEHAMITTNQSIIARLAKTGDIHLGTNPPKASAPLTLTGMNAAVDLTEYLDVQAELAKIDKKLAKLEKEKQRLEGRLHNKGFLAKAPEAVVEKSKAECAELERKIKVLQDGRIEMEKLA
ncbi:MAG: valine--tRNA ligase [Acidobacteria bacterium]|nr:MAG: valine--tRNA ligase [Acidobacteriota bacterium]